MLKILSCSLSLVCSFWLFTSIAFAAPQLSEIYLQRYFTTVAAASCMGVYLPKSSTEFDYLRSYGWQVLPQSKVDDEVETNFAVCRNYYPYVDKTIYLVTFRGSASRGDWKINLKTEQVNYGGSTLSEMQQLAAEPKVDKAPAVHAGFNRYVDTVIKTSVFDADGNLQGVFREAALNPDSYLVLTGHSLGGAVATLLGERLVSLGVSKEKFRVITFGAPAVGNAEFAEKYGKAINLLRITNTADPVPGSLQTFFGGYKQFGEHERYSLSPKVSSMQHDMAMYFDYSISEYYRERDRQISLGRLQPSPDRKINGSEPIVAVWLHMAKDLQKLAYVTDIKRFLTDEYRRMLPNYMIMEKNLAAEGYASHDIIALSKKAGADYILVCGIDGNQPRQENYWYLTLEQALFDKDGKMLTIASFGRKVAPAVGNIQAAGENLWQARADLKEKLPFLVTKNIPTFGE